MSNSVRNEEKIRQIYEAALKLFARHGYRKTSVVDIANELGMVKGNLYIYALNKRDLYEKAISNSFIRWQSRVAEAISSVEDIVDKFRIMSIKAYDYLHQDRDLRIIVQQDPTIFNISPSEDRFYEINKNSLEMIGDVLKQGIKQGRFRKVDIDSTSEFLFSVYIMFIIRTYVKTEDRTSRKLFETGLDILINGLIK